MKHNRKKKRTKTASSYLSKKGDLEIIKNYKDITHTALVYKALYPNHMRLRKFGGKLRKSLEKIDP